jgi:hypothetical protein
LLSHQAARDGYLHEKDAIDRRLLVVGGSITAELASRLLTRAVRLGAVGMLMIETAARIRP